MRSAVVVFVFFVVGFLSGAATVYRETHPLARPVSDAIGYTLKTPFRDVDR